MDMKRNERIERMIRRLGVSANLIGYEYIIQAISLVCDDPTYIRGITKRLYPHIAQLSGSTSGRVERAIRHAIEVSIPRADKEYLEKIFSYSYSASRGKPTNAEYIACLAREIALSESKEE